VRGTSTAAIAGELIAVDDGCNLQLSSALSFIYTPIHPQQSSIHLQVFIQHNLQTMSAFLAFRSAAVSVLRPRTTRPLGGQLDGLTTSPLFQTTVRGLKERSHPKNLQIPHGVVQVQDADGTLHHPHKLVKIMEGVDTTTHVVRLVSEHPPTVRILTRVEDEMARIERKLEKKIQEGKKGRAVETMEVRFKWITSGGDFEHKLAKARAELEDGGRRVELSFGAKKNAKWPTMEEQSEVLQNVVDRLADVGTEWRAREFKAGAVRVSLQPVTQKAKLQTLTQDEIEALAKEKLKKTERAVAHAKKIQEKRELFLEP
jgi:translation initiation factor IF-3